MFALPRVKPFNLIGTLSTKDGRIADLYRVTYKSAIDSLKYPENYRSVFLLSKALRIDDEEVTIQDVLDLDNYDAVLLYNTLVKAMKT